MNTDTGSYTAINSNLADGSMSLEIPIDNSCISYESQSWELFFPSPILLKTFCVSTDKTMLFIVSFTRLLIYVIVYYLLDELIGNGYALIRYILLTMIFVNIVHLGMVVSKTTLFSINNDKSALR